MTSMNRCIFYENYNRASVYIRERLMFFSGENNEETHVSR